MTAIISQTEKSAMQSGRARSGVWQLTFDTAASRGHDPLTGWIASDDTRGQVGLTFPTLEAAEAYAAAQGLDYQVRRGSERLLKIRAYADNFR